MWYHTPIEQLMLIPTQKYRHATMMMFFSYTNEKWITVYTLLSKYEHLVTCPNSTFVIHGLSINTTSFSIMKMHSYY
jgi:hypothetical protein